MHWVFVLNLFVAAATAQQSGYSYSGASEPVQQSGGFVASAPIQQHQAPVQYQAPVQIIQEVNKEFYSFTGPDEEFSIPQQQSGPSISRKNVQVIFIRAPENGISHAIQNIAQHTEEQQTAIYVLTKQPDLSQLTSALQPSNHVSHRPEVHFVKYRTHEDAARAQQSIRAQYDALGGSTSNSGDSVAPVLNFASEQQQYQGGGGGSGGGGGQGSGGHVQAPSQTYLPGIRL